VSVGILVELVGLIMPKYEFYLAVTDEPEAHRKNEGDIVTILPYGAECGSAVVDEYLIVIVELGETDLEKVKERFMQPLLENGHIDDVTFRDIYDTDGIDLVRYPRGQYVLDIKSGMAMLRPRKIGKNKYSIPLQKIKDKIPELDLVKVRDKKVKYQPMKIATQLTEKSEKLKAEDVDCGLDNTKEQTINWLSKDLIKDNSTGQFIKAI